MLGSVLRDLNLAGLGQSADSTSITKAFKRRAVELHPDKGPRLDHRCNIASSEKCDRSHSGGDLEEFQLLQQMKDVLLGAKMPAMEQHANGVGETLGSMNASWCGLMHVAAVEFSGAGRQKTTSKKRLATPKTLTTRSTSCLGIEALASGLTIDILSCWSACSEAADYRRRCRGRACPKPRKPPLDLAYAAT